MRFLREFNANINANIIIDFEDHCFEINLGTQYHLSLIISNTYLQYFSTFKVEDK